VNSPVAFGGKSAGACACASKDAAEPIIAIAINAPFLTTLSRQNRNLAPNCS
jgi:hypothetical protein